MIKLKDEELKKIVMHAIDGTLGINITDDYQIVFHTEAKKTGNFTHDVKIISDNHVALISFKQGKIASFSMLNKSNVI